MSDTSISEFESSILTLDTGSTVSSLSDSYAVLSEAASSDLSSDEEVVWLKSPSTESSILASTDSDEDFVIFRRPLIDASAVSSSESDISDTSHNNDLSASLRFLSLSSVGVSEVRREFESPPATPPLVLGHPDALRKKRQIHGLSGHRTPSSSNSTTSDTETETTASQSDTDGVSPVSTYKEASNLIKAYLDNPQAELDRLTLLQAFITELGLTSTLPTSITSAKKLLKEQAHVNIREYCAIRGGDQRALRGIMHATKSALAREIRRTGKRAPLKWVKEQGLQVFLVHCYS